MDPVGAGSFARWIEVKKEKTPLPTGRDERRARDAFVVGDRIDRSPRKVERAGPDDSEPRAPYAGVDETTSIGERNGPPHRSASVVRVATVGRPAHSPCAPWNRVENRRKRAARRLAKPSAERRSRSRSRASRNRGSDDGTNRPRGGGAGSATTERHSRLTRSIRPVLTVRHGRDLLMRHPPGGRTR